MDINIDNINIFYKFCNESLIKSKDQILLFLHEGLGSVEQWKDFPDKISDILQIPALLYDRYGYGKSSELKEERDIWYLHKETYFLEKFIEKISVNKKLILVGHSDGGTIALLYASRNPQKVDALITLAHHVFVEQVSIKGVKDAVWAYKNTDLKERLEKYHQNKVDSMFYGWANVWCNDDVENYTIEEDIKKIRAPILSFQGENDQYGTFVQLKTIIDNCPNQKNEVHWLKECGHAPQKDQEDFVIEKIAEFVKNI